MAASKILDFLRRLVRKERYDPEPVYFATPVDAMIGAVDPSASTRPRVPTPARRARLVVAGTPRRLGPETSGDFVEELVDTGSDLFNWDTSSAESEESEETPSVPHGAAHEPGYLDFLADHGLTPEVLESAMPAVGEDAPGAPVELAIDEQVDQAQSLSGDISEEAQSEPPSPATISADQDGLAQPLAEPEVSVSAPPNHDDDASDSGDDTQDADSFSDSGEILHAFDPLGEPVDFSAELQGPSPTTSGTPPLSPVETRTGAELPERLPPSTGSNLKGSGRHVVFEDQLGRVRKVARKATRRFSKHDAGDRAPKEYKTTALVVPRRLGAREKRARGHEVVFEPPTDRFVTVRSILRHSPPPPPLYPVTLPHSAKVPNNLAANLSSSQE